MSDWIPTKIGDLFDFTMPGDWGGPPTMRSAVPVLRSTNFRDDGRLDFNNVVFRDIAPERLQPRAVRKGDILIEKSGGGPMQPAGRVAYCDREFNGACSNFIEVAKVCPQFDSKFVFYLLHHLYRNGLILKYQQQTTGIINFKLGEYKQETVRIPQEAREQSMIAEVLAALDRAIEQTEALIAKHERIKTGLLQDLLTRGIDEHGRLREPGTHKFMPSALGLIPQDWGCLRSEELCSNICVGIVIKPSQYYQEAGVPTLRSANIREHGIVLDDMVFISEQSNRVLAKSMLRQGYVVSVRTGYPGTSAVVPRELDGANCVDLVISKPGPRILPHFLATWINSPFGKDQVLRGQGGLAQQHFNVAAMRNLLVLKPEIEEQKAILSILNRQTDTLRLEGAHLLKLQRLKTGLMQVLLTGKVSVESLMEPQAAS